MRETQYQGGGPGNYHGLSPLRAFQEDSESVEPKREHDQEMCVLLLCNCGKEYNGETSYSLVKAGGALNVVIRGLEQWNQE